MKTGVDSALYPSPSALSREPLPTISAHNNIVVPAQAGTHPSGDGVVEEWVPAGVYPRAGRGPDPWAGTTVQNEAGHHSRHYDFGIIELSAGIGLFGQPGLAPLSFSGHLLMSKKSHTMLCQTRMNLRKGIVIGTVNRL